MPFIPIDIKYSVNLWLPQGQPLIIGDTSQVARPGAVEMVSAIKHPLKPVAGLVVRSTSLRPVAGLVARYTPPPAPLVLEVSSEAIAGGFTITLTTPNETVPIYYTLDGTDPSSVSSATNFLYFIPFDLTNTTYPSGTIVAIKARAYAIEGTEWDNSPVEEIQVVIP